MEIDNKSFWERKKVKNNKSFISEFTYTMLHASIWIKSLHQEIQKLKTER